MELHKFKHTDIGTMYNHCVWLRGVGRDNMLYVGMARQRSELKRKAALPGIMPRKEEKRKRRQVEEDGRREQEMKGQKYRRNSARRYREM